MKSEILKKFHETLCMRMHYSMRKSMDKDVKLRTFGNELMMLYGRVNLSQREFATLVGISSVALRKWESGQSCPKAGSLKSVIEILVHKGAFEQGEEQAEALHLWELAMQRGLKAPFDEVWFARISCPVPGADPVVQGTGDQGEEENLTVPPASSDVDNAHHPSWTVGADRTGPLWEVPGASQVPNTDKINKANFIRKEDNVSDTDLVRNSEPLPYADLNSTSPNGLTSAPTKTRGRRKKLLVMLILIVMLIIMGLAGTLFFYARNHVTAQAYPGYLPGHGTLAFFDPLNQERGSQWSTSSYGGLSCQFTGGAYHASTQQRAYYSLCYLKEMILSNFALEVQLTITQGDCGGIIFRADNIGHYYAFLLCEDGSYRMLKYIANTVGGIETLYAGRSSAIHMGLGQQNKMAVVANGSTLFFYANEHQIGQILDKSYTLGRIALITQTSSGQVAEAIYSNAKLWTL
jgi:DNA-binding transcriptional regulator YiaG